MEADFNATNKIVYGDRMMNNARKYNLMPEETFSEKNMMADNGTLCKTLVYDITQQAQVPAAIASVDASNCYDRIAHAISSLVFQASGIPTTAIVLQSPYPTQGQNCTFNENHMFRQCRWPPCTALIQLCAFSCISCMLATLFPSGEVIAPSVFSA